MEAADDCCLSRLHRRRPVWSKLRASSLSTPFGPRPALRLPGAAEMTRRVATLKTMRAGLRRKRLAITSRSTLRTLLRVHTPLLPSPVFLPRCYVRPLECHGGSGSRAMRNEARPACAGDARVGASPSRHAWQHYAEPGHRAATCADERRHGAHQASCPHRPFPEP